jgi:hypothetical protein
MSSNSLGSMRKHTTPRAISNPLSSINWKPSSWNSAKDFFLKSRQKRFTFDADNFYVDLVFYNRILRCYVLIDLKIGKLTHENLGQMQMYVNYFNREVRLDEENPTIGIILCKTKNDALVTLTLPENANIYASQYQLYLPSKEELKRKLIEWSEIMPDNQEAG